MRVLLPFLLLIAQTFALFEDQIGKSDWRKQFVGCPSQVVADRTGKTERYYVSTTENVVAALSLNTGEIAWRRVLEASTHPGYVPFALHKNVICSVADAGRVVRIWTKKDGTLKQQYHLGGAPSIHKTAVTISGKVCVAVANNRATAIGIDDGQRKWDHELENSDWVAALPHDGGVALVGGSKSKEQMHIKWVDEKGVQVLNRILDVSLFNKDRIVLAGRYAVGFDGSTLYYVDILADGPDMKVEVTTTKGHIRQIVPLASEGLVGVRTSSETVIFDMTDNFKTVLSLPYASDALAEVDGKTDSKYVVVLSAAHKGIVYNLKDGKEAFRIDLNSGSGLAPHKELHVSARGTEWEALSVRADCLIEHVIIDPSRATANVDWSREESLARISSVEMLDLPLSESQAAIETEFSDEEGNVFSSFVRRVLSQAEQLKRWITTTLKSILDVGLLIQLRTSSFSELVEAVRSSAKSSSSLRGQPLERDVFNLRKLMVATSLDGTVFGIDNSDGSIVWRMYLGEHVAGLVTVTGEEKIPILVQRTTAFFNLDAQSVVAYRDPVSGQGRLVIFNPINGKIVQRLEVDSIRRVDLLPFCGDNHLHSVIVIGKDLKVSLFPELSPSSVSHALPVHIMDLEGETGELKGFRVDLVNKKLVEMWTGSLQMTADSKVVAVKGKPATQRTHSQGRVMIDRSVMYKYVNPNLVSVAVVDNKAHTVVIHMIDAVSGQMVHTARLNKATSPVHLVHCENWVAYSYWAEKGRRTEIGILELYEGEELTDKEKFDSLAATKKPVVVMQSAFIFSQGIQYMDVSETEQGVSHRSLMIALPFGNIFGVNRRMLDAMRPLELTAEMREEGGYIPYMPEIPIPSEEMVNYNQTVHNVRGIKTAPSGLESTSLMLAYGLDIFYTRLTPSGTFDILKDDFDHVLISLVLVGLIAGSFVARRLAKNHALKQQWA